MRNLTVSVEEKVAAWTRVAAARMNTSVSRFVGGLLRERMREEEDYEAAMEDYLSRPAGSLKETAGYPDRESLHDRRSLAGGRGGPA